MHGKGGVHGQGACVQGARMMGACLVGACVAGETSHCSGQYTSYWNAFLFNRGVASTGPLARGHLIWPPGHLLLDSIGLDWPPKFKAYLLKKMIN